MAIIRNKFKARFTVVDNSAITDKRLSLKTLGLYVKLISLPDNWEFSEKGLEAIFTDGLASIRSGLKELEEYGYLKRNKIRDPKTGRYINIEWQIFETSTTSPKCDFPILDNPTLDNHTEYNTNISITKEQNILHHFHDGNIIAFMKAYTDTFNQEHRTINGEYNNIYKYDPADIYLMACEFMKDYTIDKCSIDYFEKVIDRYKGIDL